MEECIYICHKGQNRTQYAEALYLNTQLQRQKHIFREDPGKSSCLIFLLTVFQVLFIISYIVHFSMYLS